MNAKSIFRKWHCTIVVWCIGVVCVFVASSACADEIFLKNDDRVSGTIVREDTDQIVIRTEAMGELTVKKEFIWRVAYDTEKPLVSQEPAPAPPKEDIEWKREISLGYNQSGGNTEKSSFLQSLLINRKTGENEFTAKGDTYYSSSDKKMDAQQWNALLRYALSFGGKKWYKFYKIKGSHDRFANIDYRLVPGVGVGYWFSDTDEWKAMAEAGIGYEYTKYRSGPPDNDTEVILVPRVYFEKKFKNNSSLSQDIILYPSLEDRGEFRLHSETAFSVPVDERLSLKLSFIDDYDSNPVGSTKKNDYKLTSGLTYSF